MYPSKTAPERKADSIVHAVSLIAFIGLGAYLLMLVLSIQDAPVIAATSVYVLAVLSSISVSYLYHLTPRHDWRPTLRRWDHAAIYTVIAGTFTPLLIVAGTGSALLILTMIWIFAVIGVAFKLLASEIDTRWSLFSYLGMGWFALFALPDFWSQLPKLCTVAIACGGLFYTIGTLFYRNKELPYRYPIWHTFGTLGGTSFFFAIWTAVSA